jgi:hypothetical protein
VIHALKALSVAGEQKIVVDAQIAVLRAIRDGA